jgi:hypothetical protein
VKVEPKSRSAPEIYRRFFSRMVDVETVYEKDNPILRQKKPSKP